MTAGSPAPFAPSAAVYDLVYRDKDFAGEARRVAALVRAAVPDAGTLLDVACGTGRHLAVLADEFAVEGLDIDAGLLEAARGRLPGVPLHQADMVDFDLGRTFDAVTCLFSAIGYVGTLERLRAAVAAMARHVAPGGVLLVEPWFDLAAWRAGSVHTQVTEEEGRTVVRMMVSGLRDGRSLLDARYLVGTPAGVETFAEQHELGLFSEDDHRAAFAAAGLRASLDPTGLTGRGLWTGRREATAR